MLPAIDDVKGVYEVLLVMSLFFPGHLRVVVHYLIQIRSILNVVLDYFMNDSNKIIIILFPLS